MATPIATLQLRTIPIPRSLIIEMIESEIGRALTHERRHYLAGQPVHCGDQIEIYIDGDWKLGRYEWTGDESDEPTLETSGRVFWLNGTQLLRWPE